MITYLVIWAGGNTPTAIDSFDNIEEATEGYEIILSTYRGPDSFVNLVAVHDGQVEVLGGPSFPT